MADDPIIRVEGLADLQRAFRVADRNLSRDLRRSLREAAEPIRGQAQQLALQEITRIGPRWWRMRVGVTRKLVYVAPRERGVKGAGRDRFRRPKFKGPMWDEAMGPALTNNIGQVERNVEKMLAEIGRDWENA